MSAMGDSGLTKSNFESGGAGVYSSGAEMWQEYQALYGGEEAASICKRYLNMQVFNPDPSEQQFCRELYAAVEMEQRNIPNLAILNAQEKKDICLQMQRTGRTEGRRNSGHDRPYTTSVMDELQRNKQKLVETATNETPKNKKPNHER